MPTLKGGRSDKKKDVQKVTGGGGKPFKRATSVNKIWRNNTDNRGWERKALEDQQRKTQEDRARSIDGLEREIKYLERRQQQRWKELVHANTWDSYEKDQEACELDTKLQNARGRIESLSEGAKLKISPDPLDPNLYDEIRIRVKKGENRAYVQYLLDGPQREYNGFFDLATSIHHLIAHKHRNHGGSSTSEPKHMGFRSGHKGKGDKPERVVEQPSKERKVQEPVKSNGKEEKVERFDLGQRVYYFNDEPGNEKWHSARVIGYLYPGDEGYTDGESQVIYKIQPDNELGQRYQPITRLGRCLRAWDWAKPCLVAKEGDENRPLVPLDMVGIDTCSALSVSSKREDFLWLDESKQAKKSVMLRGVGGETAMIGGRGPMVVEVLDHDGKKVVMFDPSGVYLEDVVNQADFRIFGQQRLKRFGFNLQQNDCEHGGDILNYNNGLKTIPLQTSGGILTLKTIPLDLSPTQKWYLEGEIEKAIKGIGENNYCIQVEKTQEEKHTSLIMNEALLSKEESARLHHWRIGHRIEGKDDLNENCPVCVEGKKKVGSYKRNYEFHGHTANHTFGCIVMAMVARIQWGKLPTKEELEVSYSRVLLEASKLNYMDLRTNFRAYFKKWRVRALLQEKFMWIPTQ